MQEFSETSTPDELEHVQGLFVRHQVELRGMLLAILPDFAAVDDVLQETFLTITRKASDYQRDSQFQAWAAAIARLHALEWRRRQGRLTTGLSPAIVEQLCAAPEAIGDEGQADREMAALEKCLQQLSPTVQKALRLRYQEGHKPAEIARRLGWTTEAIYVALSRARAALRTCIDRRLALEGDRP